LEVSLQRQAFQCLSLENLEWVAYSGNCQGKVLIAWKDGFLVQGLLDPARPVTLKRSANSPNEISFQSPTPKQILVSRGLTLVKVSDDYIEKVMAEISSQDLRNSLLSSFLGIDYPMIFNTVDEWKSNLKNKGSLRFLAQEVSSFFGLREGKILSLGTKQKPENDEELFGMQAFIAKEGYFWHKTKVAINVGNGKDIAVFSDFDQRLQLKQIKIIQYMFDLYLETSAKSIHSVNYYWSIEYLMRSNHIIMLEGENKEISTIKDYYRKGHSQDPIFELDLSRVKSLKGSSFNYEEILKYKVFWIDNISQMTSTDADELCRILRKYQGKIVLSDRNPLHLINLSLFPAELRKKLDNVPQIYACHYVVNLDAGAKAG